MWMLLRLGVEAPFLLFHISVTICVISQPFKGNSTYSGAFFTLYAILSSMDIANYMASLLLLRLPQSGLLPHTFMNYPGGNIVFFTLAYIIYFQFVAHTLMAANRYSAISLTHYKLWAGRRFRTILAVALLLPLPGVVSRFMTKAKVIEVGDGAYAVVFEDAWVFASSNVGSVLYSSVTSSVTIALELRTLFLYRKLSIQKRTQYRQEYLLLVHAMLQFVTQLLWTIFFALIAYGVATKNAALTAAVQSVHSYLIDVLCLTGPICLFSTSKVLRRNYAKMLGY